MRTQNIYKIGNTFLWKGDNEVYKLVCTDFGKIALISMFNGNRFGTPVDHPYNKTFDIPKDKVVKLMNGSSREFIDLDEVAAAEIHLARVKKYWKHKSRLVQTRLDCFDNTLILQLDAEAKVGQAVKTNMCN